MKQHVILTMYDPKSKSHKQYDALVLGAERPVGENKPALHLAYVNPEKLEQTNGINWTDSIERVLSVPHEDHKQNEAFHYEEEKNLTPESVASIRLDQANLMAQIMKGDQQITQLHERIAQLEKLLAEKGQPTSADLDTVEEENKVAEATAGQTADTPSVQ